nr:hypothetical protein OG999_29385 [Streptomyces sp. NBC_00886]
MDRAQHLSLADSAVRRAENLAGDAERYATGNDYLHKVAPLAAAGALWADIARAHAAVAAVLPTTETEV